MFVPDPLALLVLLISPAVGSFLAVLVDRLPRGEDVVRAPSACRSCGARLGLRDLVPVLSFVLLRGRCRRCCASIPPMTLYIEILAIGAAVLAVLAGGGPVAVLLNALWLWLLVALAATDLVWFRLPDPLTAALGAVALGLAALPGGIGLIPALVGAVAGAGSFAALRWAYARLRGREGLGMGDVKLMAGLGGFAGVAALPQLVLVAALMALAAALVTRGGMAGTRALPFGAALCAAGAVLWLMRAAA
ncbi:prepilin peptidase [Tateyamaria omphalii]|uniref:prepilin peptidase n=1 Tax=Tateyamaria omphalii TaxID=299262 RepID=UPI001C9925C8|nr:A24 family peptidase [Tateyamaria omphalii]MBY5935567.1 prepilin peptidase [Tateyamaria omphalii]